MQQCSHGFFSVVDSVVVNGRTINILCAGDYAQAKKRLFQYAQSIPVNNTHAQGGEITNGATGGAAVASGAGALCCCCGDFVGVGVA